MADVKIPEEERSCAEKRKLEVPNPACKTSDEKNEGEDNADSNKKQKLEISDVENGKSENIRVSSVEEEDEDDDDDEEEEEDYEEEEDEDEEAASPVDRKGKGIMIDDKGKGKMAVYEDSDDEDEDDEDDDDSTDDSDSHCSDRLDGSDVEDNPLAALDLDNILPSRTRQRRAQPGLRISNDRDNNDA